MKVLIRRLGVPILLGALLAGAAPSFAQNEMADVQVQMAEARRHFDALEYEQTVPALDRAIAILTLSRNNDTRGILADAYEMRARARFGLNDQTGARDDFVALLRTNPAHTLTGQISPRVIALFDEAQKATVTSVTLAVTPANAQVMLDGAPTQANATIPVVIGDHTVTATRLGFKPGTTTFTATAGETPQATLTLERTSAVFSIVTSPADVDVVIDGVIRGKTVAGPPSADYADRASRAGIPLASLSAVLVLPDITAGDHRIQFRKGCFVSAERRTNVALLDDVIMDPVKLEPALAPISAQSSQPNTTVFVDGERKGPTPYSGELCEGDHLVELRSPNGRYSKRVAVQTGQKVDVSGVLKPAFALVSSTAGGPLSGDLRQVVERALDPVQTVLIFAPPAEQLTNTLKGAQLPPDWLSFDANRRALGVTADIAAPMRRELSDRLAKSFEAQGIASVTVPSTLNRNRVVVSLLGAGSAEPDIFELSLDRPESISETVTMLNRPITFERTWLGFSTVDAEDVPGPVIATIDQEGPAKNVVQPGDIVLKVNDQALNDSNGFLAAVMSKASGTDVVLDIKDRTGADKKVTIKAQSTPRLIGISDQTLQANRILADLRTKVQTPANAAEESIIHLNIAAALVRLEAWSDAKAELQRVKLAESQAVGNGTVQYLLGLCAENLGSRDEAEAAYRVAASSQSLLTEDGPPVRELAEARIADMQRRPAAR